MKEQQKIKVTVITGFLGAGKTTLINNILKENPSTQFALVENEFGDVSIDTKLIKGVDASQMFELKQGCICCTITDEYELVLLELAERFPNVEHLLIETTGIAEPASVIQPFFRDENLKNIYQFSGTICLIDSLYYENNRNDEITVKQLVVADYILINKSENLSEKQKIDFQEKITKTNPFSQIYLTKFGQIEFSKINYIKQQKHSQTFSLIQKNTNHYIQTKTIVFDTPLDKDDFTYRLSYSLDVHKNEIYRTKGIICFEGELYEFILQGVRGNFELLESENLLTSTKSQIIFMGNNLPELKF